MMGNEACAEGALASGCEFAAGYPITPATEVANRLAETPSGRRHFPSDGRRDKLDCGCYRGILDRQESDDSHLGPGISLMSENIGFAVGVETPCVIVNVHRGAPGTGMPTAGCRGTWCRPNTAPMETTRS